MKCYDNPEKEQQLALNIGITKAQGEIIIRMDAHSTYKYNYISECTKALDIYPADNVGGSWIIRPRHDTLLGWAICHAVSSYFGVGNAYYRLVRLYKKEPYLNKPKWEIAVAYFCCRKEVFKRIGLFNPKLDRSEDIDFRTGLRKAGYKTLFVPTIECYYYMRTSLRDFIKHMFKNGIWVVMPLNHSPNISFSVRHVIPLLFVFSFLCVGIVTFIYPWFLKLLIGGLFFYLIVNLFFSMSISIREKDVRYTLILPLIYFLLHVSYGLGSFVGFFKLSYLKILKKDFA